VLNIAILALPSAVTRKGTAWHIGNLFNIDQDAIYLRIGKIAKSKIGIYDDGAFIDKEFEQAPYTHVVVDVRLELCAIAKKTQLLPKPAGIAKQFARLLKESADTHNLQVERFEIEELKDPQEFIEYLRTSYSVSEFWVTFKRPNPWDANRDFHQPMSRLLEQSEGQEGQTKLRGETLKPDVLEELARSAASGGDDAGILCQLVEKGQKIRKQLKVNPAVVSQEEVAQDKQKGALIQRIRDFYQRIRRGEQ
jgi:hypothetical protein